MLSPPFKFLKKRIMHYWLRHNTRTNPKTKTNMVDSKSRTISRNSTHNWGRHSSRKSTSKSLSHSLRSYSSHSFSYKPNLSISSPNCLSCLSCPSCRSCLSSSHTRNSQPRRRTPCASSPRTSTLSSISPSSGYPQVIREAPLRFPYCTTLSPLHRNQNLKRSDGRKDN